MKFTKEEINLCKQIAEKHKKKIVRGDWILDEHSEVRLAERIEGEIISVGANDSIRFISQYNPDVTPLWTISDCLEFLREGDWRVTLRWSETPEWGKYFCICSMPDDHPKRKHYVSQYANTTLEVCLKVVLIVLEEEEMGTKK